MDGTKIRCRGYRLSLEEIQQVWGIISENPSISLLQLARKMNVSRGRAYAIERFLVQSGHIVRQPKKLGFFVKIRYISARFAKEGLYARTDL